MQAADYLPISVATLQPATAVGFDLFQKRGANGHFALYRSADYPLHQEDLEQLCGRNIRLLYISKESSSRYQAYLRGLLDQSSSSSETNSQPPAGVLSEVVRDVLRAAFSSRDTDETVASVNELGKLTAEIIMRDEFSVPELFRVLHHDYATFTHSTNVAFYSAILAARLGYSQQEIQKITTGALLHDVGKLEIDDHILCKPGRLDAAEFRQVQRHPVLGFRKFVHRTDMCIGQLMMVYQHHERLAGGGYPVGCVGDEIHPWAKICTVVDVFEALTSQRPYRKPLPRQKALEILQREVGTSFDPEILACWTSIILKD